MIKSKADYKKFVLVECGFKPKVLALDLFRLYFSVQPTRTFLFLLRTCEYYCNCKHGRISTFIYFLLKWLKFRKGIQLGFSIPEHVFDIGLQLPHYGTIVVNAKARVGKNCRLHVCTNIGATSGDSKAPIIGDDVYIAPGVKIYGDIEIANHIAIAANSAVSHSFLNENMLIGGVPAKEIKHLEFSN